MKNVIVTGCRELYYLEGNGDSSVETFNIGELNSSAYYYDIPLKMDISKLNLSVPVVINNGYAREERLTYNYNYELGSNSLVFKNINVSLTGLRVINVPYYQGTINGLFDYAHVLYDQEKRK